MGWGGGGGGGGGGVFKNILYMVALPQGPTPYPFTCCTCTCTGIYHFDRKVPLSYSFY